MTSASGSAAFSSACSAGMIAVVACGLAVVTSASAKPETPSWSPVML